jgi:hypothetical protein
VSDSNLKFEVGDRVKFVLRNGKTEEGVVRAVVWRPIRWILWFLLTSRLPRTQVAPKSPVAIRNTYRHYPVCASL